MDSIKDPRFLWQALPALERSESRKIAKMLEPFRQSVEDCYACGAHVPNLKCSREGTEDIKVAALFLKRVLNDFRATWNMLSLGYTSQAGAIAAAAFENALTASCIAGHPDRAAKLLQSKTGEIPWSVSQLCKFFQRDMAAAYATGDTKYGDVSADYWRVLYAHYQWLCKVKHPTMGSVVHDAWSVSPDGKGYLMLAAPDARPQDLSCKAFILAAVVYRFHEAIERFAAARKLDMDDPDVISWQKRFDSITDVFHEALMPVMQQTPLPFSYQGLPLVRRAYGNSKTNPT